MVLSEIAVWAIAILINTIALIYFKEFYQIALLTRLMEAILTTLYPFWAVTLLSGIGTFLSIRFGDEWMDVIHHQDRKFYLNNHFKHEMILLVFFLVVIMSCRLL